jgi:hypothetical protein
VANEFDFFSGGTTNALRVSGTTGGVAIETVALYNNTTVVIDTSVSVGDDTVNITDADNAHGITNFTVTTGAGTDVTNLNGDITFTAGTVNFNGAVNVGADANTTATTVNFNSTVDGGNELTVTGNALFDGVVGGVTPLASLEVTGTTDISTTAITTTGTQRYGGNTTLSSTSNVAGPTVTFDGTVNGLFALTVTGNAEFEDTVGNSAKLTMLTVTGTTLADGGSIQTSSDQDYQDTLTLGSNLNVDSGTGLIGFDAVTDGSNAFTLELQDQGGTGDVTFGGAATFNRLTTNMQAYAVNFHGGATIATDTTFTNTGGVTLGDDAGDDTTFAAGLDTQAGTTQIAGDVATTNSQIDLGATTLTAESSISAGTSSLITHSTLAAGANNVTLIGNEIDLNGGANSVSGTGMITLAPEADNVAIDIAVTGGSGTLDLNTDDITALASGFSAIQIGRTTGTGAVNLRSTTFLNPVTLLGGASLTGPDTNNTLYTITNPDEGTVSGFGATFTFQNIGVLTGGSMDDTFQFQNPGTLSGTLSGGAGNDTLTGNGNGNVFVISGTNSGTMTGITSGWSLIENVTGGGGADSYTGGGSLAGNLIDTSGTSTLNSSTLVADSISFGGFTLSGGDMVLNTSAGNGNVALGAITGGGNALTVRTGSGTKMFNGAISGLSGAPALTLQGTGAASFASTVTTAAGGIQAVGATPVTFNADVILGDGTVGSSFGGLVTLNDAGFSGFDGVTFNGGIQVQGMGTLIQSNGSALNITGFNGGGFSNTLQSGAADTTLSGTVTNHSTLSISGNNILQPSGTWAATNITLNAGGGIGTAANVIDTNTTGLISLTTTGANATGDIYLNETGSLSTDSARLVLVTDATTGQLVCITSNTGDFLVPQNFGNALDNLKITANAGSILNSGAGGTLTANTLTLVAPTTGAKAGTIASPLNLAVTSLNLNVDDAAFGSGSVTSLSGVNLAGDFGLTVNSDVGQTGAIVIGGKFILNVGANTVTLEDAGNEFGSLGITAKSADVDEANDTELLTTVITELFELSSGGSVTQTGSLTAGQLEITAGGSVNLGGSNTIGTLAGVTKSGSLLLNNNGALTVTGGLGSGSNRIITSGNLIFAAGSSVSGSSVLASTGGEFLNTGGSISGDYLIYSGTTAGTNLGTLTPTFTQLGAPFETTPGAVGNGLLLRQSPAPDTTDIIINIELGLDTGGSNILTIDAFGLRLIEVNAASLGTFLNGFSDNALDNLGLGVFQIGDGNLEVTADMLTKLKEELSEASKEDLVAAMKTLLAGVGDVRETDLPKGLIYLENSRGQAVVIPVRLLFEALEQILSEEEKKELTEAANVL